MRDSKKALIFPETNEDITELMKTDTNLFPGCYRRNIGLEKLALVFVNISLNDINSSQSLTSLLTDLKVTEVCPIVKENENAKIIKVFFNSYKDKLTTLANYYRQGIKIKTEEAKLNIKVEPCIKAIHQCNRCNKLQHREDKCKQQLNFCSYCNQTDHVFNECKSSEFYCTNCGGNHNAYDYRMCEKYKNLKILEIKKETEYLLGLTSGTLSRREGILYAECLSYSGSSSVNGMLNSNSSNSAPLNSNCNEEVLNKLDIAIKNSQSCVQAASESLSTAQKILEKVDESMRMIAKNECESYYTRTIREVDEKVLNLRTEFNQLIYGAGFPHIQGVG